MTTLYGIANCDTVKKAQKWLTNNNIAYTFHDFRKQGLSSEQVTLWSDQLGWEVLLNKRSTTFRNLSDEIKQSLNEQSAIAQMTLEPTLIKRPVLVTDKNILVGFKEATYHEIFEK